MAPKVDGLQQVLEMLRHMEPEEQQKLLANLAARDPKLVEKLKSQLRRFEDLVRLDDSQMQALLREVPQHRLALAMRAAPEEIQENVLKNLSKRAQETLKEEMSSQGPRPLSEVRAAQTEMVSAAERLGLL